jgi:hypothetical protein
MGFMVEHNGKTLGPYSRDEVPRRVEAGDLALTDMACDEHAGHWMPLSELLLAEPVEPLTIANTIANKRSSLSAMGWGGILGIAYFFYRVARLMHACARVHPLH